MNKNEFLKELKKLEDRGYIKTFDISKAPVRSDGSDYLYKVIEYEKDKYGDLRAINQLIIKVYNFEEYKDRIPGDSYYSFEPIVCFSRDTDERIDLHIHFPKHSIEFLEKKAGQFGEWCKQYMNE